MSCPDGYLYDLMKMETFIPSTRSLLKSARRKRFIDFKKARDLDVQGFAKGYDYTAAAVEPLRTLREKTIRDKKLNGESIDYKNISSDTEKTYEKMLNGLGDEYKPYRATFVYNGEGNPNRPTQLRTNIRNYWGSNNSPNKGDITKVMPLSEFNAADFYGAPYQMNDGIANYGKNPTFDFQKWKDSNAENYVYNAMESGWDPKPTAHNFNGRAGYLPGGIENILAAFGMTWDKNGNREYDFVDNPYIYNRSVLDKFRENGKRTGINSEDEEQISQYLLMKQFNEALHGNSKERKVAEFIQKYLPGVIGRTHAYAPEYMHFFSPSTGHVYSGSPDQIIRPTFGWWGAGEWEEIIHAIDHLSGHNKEYALSDGDPGRIWSGIWSAMYDEKMGRTFDPMLPIEQGNRIGEMVDSGKVRSRDVRNLSELLSNAYLLDKRKIWNAQGTDGGDLTPEYSYSWLDTDVAHYPAYYIDKDKNFNPIWADAKRKIPRLLYHNLNAEMFNNVINPYIVGNRYEQKHMENWFPHLTKWAFDKIGEAMDRHKDEDIGATVSLRKSIIPGAKIIC